MSDTNPTSDETLRLEEQEDAIIENPKDFLMSTLRWSIDLFGAKDFLMNKQATFIAFSITLIAVFGIRPQIKSDHGMTSISFVFLILGCLVVGITLDSIILNSYIKWVIYALFIASVAVNPKYQQTFRGMQQILKSICEATSSRLGNSFNRARVALQNLLKIIVRDQEVSPMTDNRATQSADGDGSIVGENNV